jgi:hypothetical protein
MTFLNRACKWQNVIRSVILVAILVLNTNAFGSIYYVDPANGNDKNTGTITKPWKTLSSSSRILSSGDTVFLRGGKYNNDWFKAFNIGTKEMPITVKAYQDEKPIFVSSGIYGAVIFANKASWYVFDGIYFEDCNAPAGIIFATDSSNIVIRNTKFFRSGGTPIKLRNTVNTIVENSYFDTAGDPNKQGGGDLITLLGSSLNVIRNNYFTRGGHYAVVLMKFEDSYSRYNKIQNNRIEQHWGGGIGLILGSEYNLIEGNIISHVGEKVINYPKVGIQITASNNTIRNNIVYLTARDNAGIYAGAYEFQSIIQNCENNLVYNNTIYRIGGSGFYFTQKAKAFNRNNSFLNNLVYETNQAGPYTGGGLPHRTYAIWFDTYHSTRNWDSFPNRNVFRNNWLQTTGDVAYVKKAGEQSRQWGNSLSWVQKQYPEFFSNNLISDAPPQFVSEKNYDFTLKKDSPLIDKGVVVDDYNGKKGGWDNLPFCGKAPDVGAFEFCEK